MTTRVRGEQEKDPRRASAATHDETTRGRSGAGAARRDALRSAGGLAEQEAMLAPAGALDPVPMFHGFAPGPDGKCPTTHTSLADPAPFGWRVRHTRRMPSGGGRRDGSREQVTVEMRFGEVMVDPQDNHKVFALRDGTQTTSIRAGSKVIASSSETGLQESVDSNTTRFREALAEAEDEKLEQTKVDAHAPKPTDDVEVTQCR